LSGLASGRRRGQREDFSETIHVHISKMVGQLKQAVCHEQELLAGNLAGGQLDIVTAVGVPTACRLPPALREGTDNTE
jgi:hypothetical protein